MRSICKQCNYSFHETSNYMSYFANICPKCMDKAWYRTVIQGYVLLALLFVDMIVSIIGILK